MYIFVKLQKRFHCALKTLEIKMYAYASSTCFLFSWATNIILSISNNLSWIQVVIVGKYNFITIYFIQRRILVFQPFMK